MMQTKLSPKLRLPTVQSVRIERMLRQLESGQPSEDPWFIPNAMLPLFCRPARYRIGYGGRAGTRSWTFARVLLAKAVKKKLRIVCLREFQNSIEESIHQLLCDQIELMGLSPFYDVKKREIVSSVGSDFVFAGLRTNVNKMKSFEGADIAYIEEAEKISKNSWETLIPTIRKTRSEIWAAFNPDLESDPTYEMFLTNPPPPEDIVIIKTTWRDNPWLSEALRKEKDYLARVDPDSYAHVWEGGCRFNSKSQILAGKYIIEAFVAGGEGWDGPYYGVDWGFAQDPTTMIRCWINGAKLFIDYEAYALGCETIDLPELFSKVPGGDKHTSRADCARPETISHMQSHGYPNMEGVEKWSGSVEDGITFLRSFEQIVIHPRCIHAAEEAKLYSYKQDRLTKDILPDVKPGNDHIWDAVRYALGPMIRQGGASAFLQYITNEAEKMKHQAKVEAELVTNRTDYIKLLNPK